MSPQTSLPGKDATLENTIETATKLLNRIGFAVEPVSWLNPTPNCWSVHLRSKECEHLYTNGKGTSKLAALASGLGEYIERLSTNFFFADLYLERENSKFPFLFFPDEKWFTDVSKLLTGDLLKFYDPDCELKFVQLCDHNSLGSARGICTLPFTDNATGETVYFPVNILNNLYVSNGMAAGNSITECYSQALSEIIERHVKNHVIANGICLPDVPQSVLHMYPQICSILQELKNHNMQVLVKDCSLGGKFPVICVLLTNPLNGGAFAAFGASYRFETAIERTLTELLQGRQLDQLGSFNPPVHDLSLAADQFNLESHFIDSDGFLSWDMFKSKADYDFSPWHFSGSSKEEYTLLSELIRNCGHQIYTADYHHCGMPACRIIVPGMSEIYPVDDLIWNNKNSAATIRDQLLHLPHMNRDELNIFLETVEELNLSDQALVSDLIGVIFDQESAWYSLTVGELKALIFLALQNHAEAQEWCNWCYEHGNLPDKRKRHFRILDTLLGFSHTDGGISSFIKGLRLYFSKEEISRAEKIISGKITFPGLTFGKLWQDISITHNNLLKLYDRLNSCKEKNS